MNPNRQRHLRLLARIIPAVFMLLVCLVGIEIFARIIYGKPTMHFGLEMWKYAKTLKMRAPDPEMSHQHRPNSRAFLLGADVQINSLGLRNHEISTSKPPGTYRSSCWEIQRRSAGAFTRRRPIRSCWKNPSTRIRRRHSGNITRSSTRASAITTRRRKSRRSRTNGLS